MIFTHSDVTCFRCKRPADLCRCEDQEFVLPEKLPDEAYQAEIVDQLQAEEVL